MGDYCLDLHAFPGGALVGLFAFLLCLSFLTVSLLSFLHSFSEEIPRGTTPANPSPGHRLLGILISLGLLLQGTDFTDISTVVAGGRRHC